MVVPILVIPNKILTTPCEKVSTIDEEIKEVAQNLLDTARKARNPGAAGLAAPQIGSLKRVCIVRRFLETRENSGDEAPSVDYVLINPKITDFSEDTDVRYEGCLSVPNTFAAIERAKKIKVKALNENGEEIRLKANGFFARIIQHEVDHLNGILITDKAVGKTLTEKEIDEMINRETQPKKLG